MPVMTEDQRTFSPGVKCFLYAWSYYSSYFLLFSPSGPNHWNLVFPTDILLLGSSLLLTSLPVVISVVLAMDAACCYSP